MSTRAGSASPRNTALSSAKAAKQDILIPFFKKYSPKAYPVIGSKNASVASLEGSISS